MCRDSVRRDESDLATETWSSLRKKSKAQPTAAGPTPHGGLSCRQQRPAAALVVVSPRVFAAWGSVAASSCFTDCGRIVKYFLGGIFFWGGDGVVGLRATASFGLGRWRHGTRGRANRFPARWRAVGDLGDGRSGSAWIMPLLCHMVCCQPLIRALAVSTGSGQAGKPDLQSLATQSHHSQPGFA